MEKQKISILFITHDASRSGAPLALLNLVNWLSSNSKISISILLPYNGEIVKDFAKNSNKIFILQNVNSKHTNISYKIFKTIVGIKNYFLLKKIKRENFDIIYSNSIASNNLLSKLKISNNSKIISNIHELNFTFKSFNITENSFIIKQSDLFLCVNKIVSMKFCEYFNVLKEKITVIPAVTNINLKKPTTNLINLKSNFIIGASGTVEWRKGSDLFIQLALVYKKKYGLDNEKFIWTGKFPNEIEKYKIQLDIKNTELEDYVFFVGEITNVADYYSTFDVFALMSREEALGLVCIENMAFGNPVICFEKCGGMHEIADAGAAIKVPYLNLEKMADEIFNLKNNGEFYLQLSQKSIEYVKSEFDHNKIGKQYLEVFEEILKK